MEALFFQTTTTTSANLLLGFMPDALGLLILGVGLIVFAASLRWVFNRKAADENEDFSGNIHRTAN